MPPFVLPAGITHDVARTRAFYLLKKYTSATSLQRAIGLYRDFLRDFEHEIRKPEHVADSMWNTYQEDLLYFLRYLEPMEHAEPLLASPLRRTEAFALLREAVDFSAFMWGRRYQEWGASEPGSLYYELGYRYLSYDSIDVFGKAQLSAALISLMSTTISHDGVKRGVVYLADNHGARTTKRWTYEGIFFDVLSLNRIPTILFPPHLPSCPPPNANSDGQIWSGQTIPVTGIWEPWPIDPSIGPRCPNYYLAADTASQYQLEGTDTLEDVRWRLIWKDTRYADGNIPHEEQEYFAPPPPAVRNRRMLTAYPGNVCPRSGEWFSHHLNRRINVQAGEPMPGPERGKTGAVIWYLELDD